MAWRSSGTSNADLVAQLWRNNLITLPRVRDAFLAVDRAQYCPRAPYQDSPQSIGYAATISAPHMHAAAVEKLIPFVIPPFSPPDADKKKGEPDKEEGGGPASGARGRWVLDIGSGSGYLTHVLAELVGPTGRVVGVEHVPELAAMGEANMQKSAAGCALLESGRVRFVVGDGRKGWAEAGAGAGEEEEGEPNRGLWDAIHVGASAVTLHQELVDQLRAPGRMFIPVDDDDGGGSGQKRGQHIWAVDKDANGKITKERLFAVRYVPLTDGPQRR